MCDKKTFANDRRWWKRLISSNPEGIEIRPEILEPPNERQSRRLITRAGVPPREPGEPCFLPRE